jgi:hypothetical protein
VIAGSLGCRFADLRCRAAACHANQLAAAACRHPWRGCRRAGPGFGEAVTNAILCGFLQHPAGQGRRRVHGGWIEATIGDRATPAPHTAPLTSRCGRGGRWLTGLLVDEVCLARARAGMLVTLRRCIPRGLVIVDAPGPIGVVEMIFPKAYDGQYRTPGIAWVEREVDATPARQPAPVALGSYLPNSSGKRRGRPPRSLQRPHDERSASGGHL